jgi:chromate transporter
LQPEGTAQARQVSLLTIFLVFLKVGAFTFGGGYAMLPVIQREVVYRQKWVDQAVFLDSLIITQSIPGPLALNNSIIIGQRLRGLRGGLTAALGVTIPSILVILTIVAFFLPYFQEFVYVQAVFYGLRPAVVALITAAAFNLSREMLRGWASALLAAALLAAALFLRIHPIAILVGGGITGLILFRGREV